jgi:outer membrane murein-binding lipoprotein Lpp
MPKSLDDHLKLLTGDLVLTVARLAAENEALREQLQAAVQQLARTSPPKPDGEPQP